MNNKKYFLPMLLLVLLFGLIGISYAYFNYTKTGPGNSVAVGRVYFNTNQSDSLSLTSVAPMTRAEATAANLDYIPIDIEGDTTYSKRGIEYVVRATNINNTVNNKKIPISIVVTYTANSEKTIGTPDENYFMNRGGSDSIYKIVSADIVNNDDIILVGYITNGQSGIDGVINIKAFIDSSKIVVSNQNIQDEDKTVLTVAEWNSLRSNNTLSFKVKVEANEGVWVQESVSSVSTINFNSKGGSPVASMTVNTGEAIGSLPTNPTLADHVFMGWYTAETDGTKVEIDTVINGSTTLFAHWNKIVCKKATQLHSYSSTNFGTIPQNGNLVAGYAYDCDVNDDDTYDSQDERFYYLVTDNSGNGVFIYSNNTHYDSTQNTVVPICGADAVLYNSDRLNYKAPTEAAGELPSSTQWSGVTLHNLPRQIVAQDGATTAYNGNTIETYDYSGKSSRFATTAEIIEACNISVDINSSTLSTELNSCLFLLENTSKYVTSCRSNYWLETPQGGSFTDNSVFRVNKQGYVGLAHLSKDLTKGFSGVRPVIEVPTMFVEGIPTTYRVLFNTQGGSAVSERTIAEGQQLGDLPEAPTKSGYTFGGWYVDSEYTTQATSSTIINHDMTIYAKWNGTSSNVYNITFNPNQGSFTNVSDATREVTQGSELGTLPVVTRTNYTFGGWYLESDTNFENEITSSRIPQGNETYVAKWTAVVVTVHTVTFNPDGGSFQNSSDATRDVNHGSAVGQLPTPSKSGYSFDGWYLVDEANHSSTYSVFIEPNHEVNQDEEYLANWVNENYVAVMGNQYFETLNAAIEAVPTTGVETEIRIIKDATVSNRPTIASTQNVLLKTGSHTLTCSGNNIIWVKGTLRITDGTYICAASGKGVFDVESTGTLRISGGTISNTNDRAAIYNGGNLYISGDAYLSSKASQRAVVHNYQAASRLYMSGGTLDQTNGSCDRGGIENANASAVVEITGGIVKSASTNNNSGGIKNSGKLTIGTSDGVFDSSGPIIMSGKYGVNSTTNYAFYDGKVMGVSAATNNNAKITQKEPNVNEVIGTETIGASTYHYLYYELQSGYTLTLNANGGSGVPATRTIAEGAEVGQLPTPERTNYIFDGWYLDSDVNFQNEIQSSRVPTGDETYVAKWVQSVTLATITNPTITLVGTGSGVNETINVTNASSIENYTYSSSDPFIATVSSSGVVSSVGPGYTTITLTGASSGETKKVGVTVNLDNNTPTFDIMPTAMRTYFDNINEWADGETDSSHDKYSSAMSTNLSTNNCVNFNGDDRANASSTTGSVFCDQPNQYNTGITGNINVYEYDYANSTIGSAATYVTNDNGKLYNFIPGRVYYWENASNSSQNGKVYIHGERRIITVDNSPSNTFHQIRNIRDLGGIQVDTDGDGTPDGTIKYGKLFRGEKVWTGDSSTNTQQMFTKLGINHEMDLRKYNEPVTSEETTIGTLLLNGDNPSTYKTYEVVHYEINYSESADATYYALARKALIDIMNEFINDTSDTYSLYFHCRIGADRTGMIAYLLEGLLGVDTEDRYRDYEMTVFFGIDERTRFYYNKGSVTKKFVYMKNAIKASNNQQKEDVMAWFLQGSTNATADRALVTQFRNKLINYY